jgi:hypothetical protein
MYLSGGAQTHLGGAQRHLESCHAGVFLGLFSRFPLQAQNLHNITWVQSVSGHLPSLFSDADKGKKTNVMYFCFAGEKPKYMHI